MTIAFPLLRREEPPEPAPPQAPVAPEPQPEAVPAPQEGADMGTLEQCVAIVRHAFRVARRRSKDLAEKEGGWVNGLLAAKPPSVNEQREYLRNRGWLPPGHEGGIADIAGQGFQESLGIPGVALGDAISALHARPFRYVIAGVVLLASIALVIVVGDVSHVTHIGARAVLAVLGAVAGPPTAWWLLVTGCIAVRRWLQASRTKEN